MDGQTERSEILRCRSSRRDMLKTVAVSVTTLIFSTERVLADESGFGRYVKQRALEPLQNYVLPLLAAKKELKRAGALADEDASSARSLLREGVLSSLRYNARAVGEYAERLGTSTEGPALVTDVNRSIERFDTYLLLFSRNQETEGDPKQLVDQSIAAIETLLQTVPSDVMDDVTGQAPARLSE